jgi:ATP-dependent DNA helicase RecQ
MFSSKMPVIAHQLQQWGVAELRSLQRQTLDHLLAGRSGLVVLPTGSGKSLIYQLFAKVIQAQNDSTEPRRALCLVVTPLVALMEDQVRIARNMGIFASCTHAGQSKDLKKKFLKQLARRDLELAFVTPERFRRQEFWQAIKPALKLALLVIDEAHCASQWGQDFRPDYAKLGEVRRRLGQPVTLACTATASPKLVREICDILDFNCPNLNDSDLDPLIDPAISDRSNVGRDFILKAPIARPELRLKTRLFESEGEENFKLKIKAIKAHLSHEEPSIIYTSLIQTLLKIKAEFPKAWVFHGELPFKEKKKVLKQFLNAEQGLLIATSSFGLGVNKANIRQVIHFDLPPSVEAYYQEAGRAGRDGRPARALLLFSEEDLLTQMEFIKWNTPDLAFVQRLLQVLRENRDRCESEGLDYLREQLHYKTKRDYRIETTLRVLSSLGILAEAKNRLGYQLLLDLDEKAKTRTEFKIRPQETVTETEPDPISLDKLLSNYFKPERQEYLLTQLHQLFVYAKQTEVCRMNWIEKYFGENPSRPCGHCDLCLNEG